MTAPERPPGTALRTLWREGSAREDWLAEEVPVALRYNGTPFAVMMATPLDLEDFALGFSLSEGLIDTPAQLLAVSVEPQVEGVQLSVKVTADAPAAKLDAVDARRLPGRSGCGLCGAREIEQLMQRASPIPTAAEAFTASALRRALSGLAAQQRLNALTGAVHAAAWADRDGHILLLREDVGRHNALDKLIGALCHDGLPLGAGMLLITSRASYEMVAKAATVGIGLLAALSAPTALAVDIARRAGLCLVGFARADGFNVYSAAERLDIEA